tara:strand:- start:36 stop:665 length:630 start_codon:yes stop_codon:yes gene_type:complete
MSSFLIYSQNLESSKDFQTWHNLELKHKVLKKIDLSFEGGVRLMDNSRTVYKYFTDLSVIRKHNDLFSYSLGYRYLLNRNNNSLFDKYKRFYGDFSFKKILYNRLSINLRTRFQSQIDPVFGFKRNVKNKLREKIKFNYPFKEIDLNVFSSIEVFYFFDNGFEKIRYIIGVKKSLIKKLDLGLNFMYQHELNDPLKSVFAFRTTISYRI